MPRFTTSDGIGLHYETTGSGQPLLCLPGLTRNTRDFDFLAPHVPGLQMIAMDYRGRGQSDNAPDFNSYNVPREARDAIELLDHLGLAKSTILGTSRGGLIAMALAATFRDRVSGVILNDVGPEISSDGIARIMDYVGQPPAARALEDAAAAMKAMLEQQFPTVPDTRWHQLAAAQFKETATGLALRYDPRLRDALLAQASAGPAPDLWPLFDALTGLPAGVLRGANSDLLTAETFARMQARNPALVAVTVPDRGHVPFLDEPESLSLVHNILKDTS